MNQAPVDQAQFWNEAGGQRWVANIEHVERMIEPLNGLLLARAAPCVGERVLDIGCGGGVTSAAFAQAVGPTGQVLGVDVSAVILEVARRRYAGVPGLAFEIGDAATMALAGFDLIVSRFGVMFFPDPPAAFANLRRAIAPRGRLAFVCWRALDLNPWMGECAKAAFSVLPPPEPTPPGAPGPFAFADVTRLREILEAAGYAGIEIEALDLLLDLGTPEDAIEQMTRMGPAAPGFAAAESATRAAVVDALRAVFAAYFDGARVRMPGAVWLVRAQSAPAAREA
jgi:SAM-dependent methyltransferase